MDVDEVVVAPDAPVVDSAAAEPSAEPSDKTAALDAAPDEPLVKAEDLAPEAEVTPDAAAADPEAPKAEDAEDPDVQEVTQRFTKDGKLDAKAMAKALKENETLAKSIDPNAYQQSQAFLADMRELYQTNPEAKKIIDDHEARKRGVVEVRPWADVQREANELSLKGKTAEAYELLKKYDPEMQELRSVSQTIKAEQTEKQKAADKAEVDSFRSEVEKEFGAKPTQEEEAAMYHLISKQGAGWIRNEQGAIVGKRPLMEVFKHVVLVNDQKAAQEAAFARRKVAVAGKPTQTPKPGSPAPAGKTVTSPKGALSSGDPELDKFLDELDAKLGITHGKTAAKK